MSESRLFPASCVLCLLALPPAGAFAGDELDVTMEVVDDLDDDEIAEMRGPEPGDDAKPDRDASDEFPEDDLADESDEPGDAPDEELPESDTDV